MGCRKHDYAADLSDIVKNNTTFEMQLSYQACKCGRSRWTGKDIVSVV